MKAISFFAYFFLLLNNFSNILKADISFINPISPNPIIPLPNPLPPVLDSDFKEKMGEINAYCNNIKFSPFIDITILIVDKSNPNAYQTIQEAVDAAKNGGSVFIKNGVYREYVNSKEKQSSSFAPVPNPPYKRLNIYGESRNGVIIEAPNKGELSPISIGNGTRLSSVTVKGGNVGVTVVSGYAKITNIISHNNRVGILVRSGLGYELNNKSEIYCNSVFRNHTHGIMTGASNSSADADIKYNHISNNGEIGISKYKGNSNIKNNIILVNGTKENGTGIIILESGSQYKHFIENNFIMNQRNGITIARANNMVIKNNLLKNSQYAISITGVYVEANNNINVFGNVIKRSEIFGIKAKAMKMRIENNLIVDSGSYAFNLTVMNLALHNNTIVTADKGIALETHLSSGSGYSFRVYNNIINQTNTAISLSCGYYNTDNCVAKVSAQNNLFWQNSINLYNLPNHHTNIFANPLFLDSANENFSLYKKGKTSSPAIDRGRNYKPMEPLDLAKKTRLIGQSIDCGAYESQN